MKKLVLACALVAGVSGCTDKRSGEFLLFGVTAAGIACGLAQVC